MVLYVIICLVLGDFMKKILTTLCSILIIVLCGSLLTVFLCRENETKNVDNFSKLSYVALGDSITYGVDGVAGGKMDNPYPEIVAETLNLSSVKNYGIKGSTLAVNENGYAPMSVRYSEMENADIVSVLGGVNDYFRNVPLGSLGDTENTTVYGALNTLVLGLRRKYTNSFIFFMTPYQVIDRTYNSVGYTVNHVADAVKNVCALYNIPVLDLYSYGGFENEAKTNTLSDKVHPSQNFVEKYTAPQIVKFIKDNYSKNK